MFCGLVGELVGLVGGLAAQLFGDVVQGCSGWPGDSISPFQRLEEGVSSIPTSHCLGQPEASRSSTPPKRKHHAIMRHPHHVDGVCQFVPFKSFYSLPKRSEESLKTVVTTITPFHTFPVSTKKQDHHRRPRCSPRWPRNRSKEHVVLAQCDATGVS